MGQSATSSRPGEASSFLRAAVRGLDDVASLEDALVVTSRLLEDRLHPQVRKVQQCLAVVPLPPAHSFTSENCCILMKTDKLNACSVCLSGSAVHRTCA